MVTVESLNKTVSDLIAYRFELRRVTFNLLQYVKDTYPRDPISSQRELEEANRRRKLIEEAEIILNQTYLPTNEAR